METVRPSRSESTELPSATTGLLVEVIGLIEQQITGMWCLLKRENGTTCACKNSCLAYWHVREYEWWFLHHPFWDKGWRTGLCVLEKALSFATLGSLCTVLHTKDHRQQTKCWGARAIWPIGVAASRAAARILRGLPCVTSATIKLAHQNDTPLVIIIKE